MSDFEEKRNIGEKVLDIDRRIEELEKNINILKADHLLQKGMMSKRRIEIAEVKERLDAMNIREVIQEEVEQVREVLRGFMDDVRYILDKEIHSHSMDYLNDRVEEHKTKLSGSGGEKECLRNGDNELESRKPLQISQLGSGGFESVCGWSVLRDCAFSKIRKRDCKQNNYKYYEPREDDVINIREMVKTLTNKEWVLVKREKIEFWRKELLNKTDEVLKSMREV